MEIALAKFKLAVISHDEFTDDEVEALFYKIDINDFKDMIGIIGLLKRNRPKLFKKLEAAIKNRK